MLDRAKNESTQGTPANRGQLHEHTGDDIRRNRLDYHINTDRSAKRVPHLFLEQDQ